MYVYRLIVHSCQRLKQARTRGICARVMKSNETSCRDLEHLEDGISTRDLERLQMRLELGVGDLAVVDDDGVPSGAGTHCPAERAAELGLVVRGEDLCLPSALLSVLVPFSERVVIVVFLTCVGNRLE